MEAEVAKGQKTLRRQPRQERSRERVEDVLRAAMALIGEKGIAATTMRDIAAASGMPLATVYHYFPNKTAVIALLYQHYSEATRNRIMVALETVKSVADIPIAAEAIIDFYYARVRSDPAIQDLLNAIQADKALKNADIEETRSQSVLFSDATDRLIADHHRQDYRRSVYLLFQLAGATVRLALSEGEEGGALVIADYYRLIRGQMRQFDLAEADAT
jgi:AcrR family transcriptional regulator